MRITIINLFYRPDVAPTAHLAASLAEHRAALGDQVTIIAGKGAYAAKDAHAPDRPAAADNPRVRRLWTPGLGKANNLKRTIDYAAFYLFAIWRMLTLPRQDVIISLTTPPIIAWTAMLHKLLHRRTRLILWNMDCYPDLAERSGVIKTNGLVARLARARNRAIYRRLDHLVCLDTAMAHLLCQQYAPVNPRLPVTIIPNWEDASFFPAEATYGPFPLSNLLAPDGRFIVLYLGNMGYGHSFETVLDAAEALRDDPITFLFVGGGRRAGEISQAAASRGLTNILVHGYIPKDQTGALMKHAGCALITLRDEILGVMSPSKIHSNMALGLPLLYIGPETSNVDDAIHAHGVGLSLRHGEVDRMVTFLRDLLHNPAERARLSHRARAAFDNHYCDLATLPRFDAVIQHALTGRGPTGIPDADAEFYARPPQPRQRTALLASTPEPQRAAS